MVKLYVKIKKYLIINQYDLQVKILRLFLYIISGVFLFNSIILVGRKSFTLGLALMVGIAVVSFILARYFEIWNAFTASGLGMYLKYFIMMILVLFIFLASYVLSFAHSTTKYDESAIIILGCGLNSDGTPSHTLQNRLDGGLDYYNKNPDCHIVVTGALSRFGNATEGAAMKKYLVDKGVPAHKVLVDEKATNTKENFEYSLELLKNNHIDTENVVFVTNSFHIFRARQYAVQAGFDEIEVLSVKTDRAVFLPAVIREVCAVAMQMFFKY